jgi:hypothetical protein
MKMVCLVFRQSNIKERNQPYHTIFHSAEQANRICRDLSEKKKDLREGEEWKVIGLYEDQ